MDSVYYKNLNDKAKEAFDSGHSMGDFTVRHVGKIGTIRYKKGHEHVVLKDDPDTVENK